MKLFLIKLIGSHTGISSKRVCGILGWLLCISITIYCTIKLIQAPNIVDTMLWCCVGLLGVDSVADIWKTKLN